MRISFVSALTLDQDMHKTRELEILKGLAQRGHAATLVAITSKIHFQMPDKRVKLVSVPIRYVSLISPFIWGFVLFFYLPWYILLNKPDFIITDPEISVISSIPCCFISRLLNVRFILDVRSTPVEVSGFPNRLKELLFNISILVAKKLFAGTAIVTSLMKEEVCNKFGLKRSSVDVWTNGVPLNLFNPQGVVSESEALKKRLGLEKKFIVFYHGAFSPTRGLTQTVAAIETVRQRFPHVVLFLLGSGSSTSELRALIKQKNLQNNVYLHIPVPYEEVPTFIGLSDVCIVPLPDNSYWRYQNALNLLEYLAMEKVVLATDIQANRIIVDNAPCCIYVKSVDPLEVAKSIEYAYSNLDRLQEWGITGRGIIQKEYTWDIVAERIEEYFMSLIKLHDQ
jgi:glycosyltransferase involved in cell wall biosynthesis